MYLAGLNLSLTPRLVEGTIWGTTVIGMIWTISTQIKTQQWAAVEGGRIKTEPPTPLGKQITFFHSIPMIIPPLAFVIGVPLNGFDQPSFFERFKLPLEVSEDTEVLIRLGAALGMLGTVWLITQCFKHLSKNFHFISVRKNSNIVSTGPYSVVRHPIYTIVLLNQLLFGIAFWSTAPFWALLPISVAFAIKIPIEEELLLKDEKVGADYAAYSKKVTWRIIPWVW